MSFILDALKKSEAERKRQDAPGIASIPEPTENSSGSKWIWIIAALLTINVVVLTGVVLRPSGDEHSQNAAATQAAGAEPPAREAGAAAESIPAGESATTPAGAVVSNPAPTPVADATATGTDPTPAAIPEPAPAEPSGLPTFDELRTAGRLQLPDLHVDIHVYSARPADRFVFVNMTKYRENAKLAEGPVVTRITPDGVELDYLGTAFLLPRE
jgi:general secretion pathway protein B